LIPDSAASEQDCGCLGVAVARWRDWSAEGANVGCSVQDGDRNLCVFSPKLNTMTFFDKMLFIVCEFGGDSLDSNKRLRVAPLMLADTNKTASIAIKYCCWLIARLQCLNEARVSRECS